MNGALVSSNTVTYTPNTTRPLRIAAGRTELPAQYFLPGRVDEVAVYGTALSAARVQAHFAAAGSSGGGNQPPNAVASGSPTSGTVPLDGQLRRLGLERSRRHDRLLRLGPRRRRRLRRLDGPEPVLHVHRLGHVHGPAARDRRRRRARRLRSGHDHRAERGRDVATARRSSPTPRSPTGASARRAGRRQPTPRATTARART